MNKDYAAVNIFVGKYKVPKSGWIKLPNARIRFLHRHESLETPDDGVFSEGGDGPLWLIIEDGGFWPVMARMPEPTYDTVTRTNASASTVWVTNARLDA